MTSSSRALLDNSFSLLNGVPPPPGFGFHPTEEEIIHYLQLKIDGSLNGVHCCIPHIVNYNTFNPRELAEQSRNSNKEWFFFSQLKHESDSSKRYKRSSEKSKGRWKSTGKQCEVKTRKNGSSSRSVIGKRKVLTYYLREGRTQRKTDWVLHEYHHVSNESGLVTLVLCHLKNENSHTCYGTYDLAHDNIISAADYFLSCKLSTGFRFQPTHEELVDYLRQKIHGMNLELVDLIISEIDLYDFQPWELPGKSRCKSNKEWFFFTRLERYKNTRNTRRAVKKGGQGTWKPTGQEHKVTKKNVDDNSQYEIGKRKVFTFDSDIRDTQWVMHEYSILPAHDQVNLVLCKIMKKSNDGEQMPIYDCNHLNYSIAADDYELTETLNSLFAVQETPTGPLEIGSDLQLPVDLAAIHQSCKTDGHLSHMFVDQKDYCEDDCVDAASEALIVISDSDKEFLENIVIRTPEETSTCGSSFGCYGYAGASRYLEAHAREVVRAELDENKDDTSSIGSLLLKIKADW